ncbi:hypothetical protein TOPH_08353, partial [Tolypocladium ophioglossoides CBS 100239]
GPRPDARDAPLAGRLPAARRLGHRLRARPPAHHGGRRPALAPVGALQALRPGRPRLRLEGPARPQRLHRRPGLPEPRRVGHVRRLPVAGLCARHARRRRRHQGRGRPRRRRRRLDWLQRRRHDAEQDGAVLDERVLQRLRQHRPQPLRRPHLPLDHPQRRVARRPDLHDLVPRRRHLRRPRDGLRPRQEGVVPTQPTVLSARVVATYACACRRAKRGDGQDWSGWLCAQCLIPDCLMNAESLSPTRWSVDASD